MHQHFEIIIFCLTLFLFLPFTQSSTICTLGKEVSDICECEHIKTSFYSDDLVASSLICHGQNAFRSAREIIRASRDRDKSVFVKVTVTNASIDDLKGESFRDFQGIQNLSLVGSGISKLDSHQFRSVADSLIELNLSFNNIARLPDNIFGPSSLRNLTIHSNRLKVVDPSAFSGLNNLVHLDLSRNELEEMNPQWFSPLESLQNLLLGHNKMVSIQTSAFNHVPNLQWLDLSSNQIKMIPRSTFHRLKKLRFLSLAANELQVLDENIFQRNENLAKVVLTGNSWICDQNLLPLNDQLKQLEPYKEQAFCSQPIYFRNYTVQHGLDVFYLEMKVTESPTCNATMCNCTVSRDKLVVTVDCSGRGFTHLPEILPYKAKALNMHGNRIRSLNIDHIDTASWSDVSFLYLNANVIDSLKGLEGSWLLRNLVALHLSNNSLTEIPIHVLAQFRGGLLDELYLADNPWACDCNTVRFQTWLQDNYRAVRNLDGICCSADSGPNAGLAIHKFKKSQLCPQQVQLVNYLDVLNGLMGLAIVLIIAKLSYDYWLQKRTGKLPRFFSLNL